ncbi:MAG: cytochrome c maturation protein CcmE [Cyclobacteriaceae bacterium]
MKRSYIIAIIVIAVAAAIIISSTGDAGTYVTFNQAREMAENGRQSDIHVVGQLLKDDQGHILGIQPSVDKMSFSFVMVDENQQEQQVYYNEPMPPDFMRSEQVVVIGGYKDDQVFVADKILLKCPSKYQETTVEAGI